ncbi:glutathione S-transferase [Canariomyces notabilis]|uniref:Glutathione S-transferase n=1 Tax=Canariomyces notabilis TaxID=2074819 RepID=A0AAN6TN02_9PEZI|nr:glutathione S-transferase [Canariomyces arenarius]
MSLTRSDLKPIKVWGKGGPNPPKVAILLEELGVPYEAVFVPLADLKKPEYTAINPNGRLPSIYDPNTGLTLWESGAIIEYLVEKYDTDHKLSFPAGSPESYLAKQYLFFQVSGQGPYYGQAAWFKKFHDEQLPSAIARYVAEVNRVTGVLEGILKKKAEAGGTGPWLVGDKYSFADMAFVSWQTVVVKVIGPEEYNLDDYPYVKGWMDRMLARPAVQAGLDQGGKMS